MAQRKVVHLVKQSPNFYTLKMDEPALELEWDLTRSRPQQKLLKSLAISLEQAKLTIRAQEEELAIEISEFGGVQAVIPKGQEVILEPEFASGLVNIATSATNTQSILLEPADGGRVELGAESAARFDFFSDQSYTLTGRGRVKAENSDGQPIALSIHSPPMTGGPLVERMDATGTKRFVRLEPTAAVKISGSLGELLGVQAGPRQVTIEPGRRQRIDLDNGASLELHHNSLMHTLDWRVAKGDFRLSVEGIPGWKAIGLTGQQGSLQWSREIRTIDLKNLSAKEGLLVCLPSRTIARIEPQAFFQYSEMNSMVFATSAAGGTVTLFNENTLEMTRLDQGNLLFKAGMAVAGFKEELSSQKLRISWGSGAAVHVVGTRGALRLEPGARELIEGSSGGKLLAQYEPSGQFQLQAMKGNYQIQLTPLQDWLVELKEGNFVIFHLDARKRIFTLRTSPQNRAAVKIVRTDGLAPDLGPGSTLTMLMARSGALLAGSEGPLIFFESAGAAIEDGAGGASAFALAPAVSFQNTRVIGPDRQEPLDVSRISQPPVSPFK